MQPPSSFPRSLLNAKESYQGPIIGNLFYILCSHFREKNGGTTLPGGRVSRQSMRIGGGGCNLFQLLDILIRHFEKYLHTMMLKLKEHV